MARLSLPEQLWVDPTSPKEGWYGHLGLMTITTDDPAANAEISYTVPTGRIIIPRLLTVSCVQGLTQTPLVTLLFANAAGTTIFSSAGSSAAQNSSVTTAYSWFIGQTQGSGGAATSGGNDLKDLHILRPGYTVTTSTNGKGANTNHGVMTIEAFVMTL